jgi:hypothetical protein
MGPWLKATHRVAARDPHSPPEQIQPRQSKDLAGLSISRKVAIY